MKKNIIIIILFLFSSFSFNIKLFSMEIKKVSKSCFTKSDLAVSYLYKDKHLLIDSDYKNNISIHDSKNNQIRTFNLSDKFTPKYFNPEQHVCSIGKINNFLIFGCFAPGYILIFKLLHTLELKLHQVINHKKLNHNSIASIYCYNNNAFISLDSSLKMQFWKKIGKKFCLINANSITKKFC